MKLLLDENLPKDLKREFLDHEVFTVQDRGWSGLKNGDLLRSMVAAKFDTLLTLDKHLEFQQNLANFPIGIVLVRARSNRIEDLVPLVPRIIQALTSLQAGAVTVVGS